MARLYSLPAIPAVTEMLSMLLGGDLKVKTTKPLTVGPTTLVTVYVDDKEAPVAAVACDMAFAVYAGSALSMIPVGVAKDAIKTGKPSDIMVDNLREVMNICSRLFMNDDTPHLKLAKLYFSNKELPEDAAAMLRSVAGRADFEIAIPRYASGCLSFLAT